VHLCEEVNETFVVQRRSVMPVIRHIHTERMTRLSCGLLDGSVHAVIEEDCRLSLWLKSCAGGAWTCNGARILGSVQAAAGLSSILPQQAALDCIIVYHIRKKTIVRRANVMDASGPSCVRFVGQSGRLRFAEVTDTKCPWRRIQPFNSSFVTDHMQVGKTWLA
jgi:hypothetical protein